MRATAGLSAAVCDEADTRGNFRAIEQLLQRWLLERQRAVSGEPAAAVAVAAAVAAAGTGT